MAGKTPVTSLQEWCVARGMGMPEYSLLSNQGPSHQPMFHFKVTVGELVGYGQASNKKLARHKAAADVLDQNGISHGGEDISAVGAPSQASLSDVTPSGSYSSSPSGMDTQMGNLAAMSGNPVGELQERTQKLYQPPPQYETEDLIIPGQLVRTFRCTVTVAGITKSACAASKKTAKRNAASAMLQALNEKTSSKGRGAQSAYQADDLSLESFSLPQLTGTLSLKDKPVYEEAGLFGGYDAGPRECNPWAPTPANTPTRPSAVMRRPPGADSMTSPTVTTTFGGREERSPAVTAASGDREKRSPTVTTSTPAMVTGYGNPRTLSSAAAPRSPDPQVTERLLEKVQSGEVHMKEFAGEEFDAQYDYKKLLKEAIKKKKMSVEYKVLDCLSVKERHQCFLTLSTKPQMVMQGSGISEQECEQRAAHKALDYFTVLYG